MAGKRLSGDGGQTKFGAWFLCLLLIGCSAVSFSEAVRADTIPLAGNWRFALDPDDVGVDQQWHDQSLQQTITLPGILQSQGYGDPISIDTPWVLSLYDRHWYLRRDFKKFTEPDNVKVPFLSQPPRHYLGPAWYRREITIPEDWVGRRVGLKLERTRWQTTAWLDDKRIGSQDSLVAPHYYEFGIIKPGAHQLTIRVDNRMLMDYRPDAHSVSDSLGSTWNGIVGDIQLFSSPPVWIDDIRTTPDVRNKSVSLEVQIGNITKKPGKGTLSVGSNMSVPVSWTEQGGQVTLEVPLGKDAPLWSEFNPKLHQLTVSLYTGEFQDRRTESFGLREISTNGHDLLVNGQKSHFRGTHSGGDFPKTGYPATDIAYWRKLFGICQEWGLNHMRFHSFCPPEAAFTAADEMGFYLQPECGMWNVISPGTKMEQRMYEETERMIREYGNHPSFVLFSPSNEPKGHWKESLTAWVEHYRKLDPRRLYTTGTGWPLIDEPGHVEGADFLAVHRIGPRPVRGSRAWFGRDYLSSMRQVDVPIIVHELGQWCAYPDYDIIDKFNGYLQPGNYEIFRDSMKEAGLLELDKAFAQASGHLQAACYKEEVEANLRTPGLAGFQLLDLHDYLGQGTALVGVLDAFWEEKGYITAKQWRRFCNTTVPLAVLKKRVFTTDDPFEIDIQAAHYGPTPLDNVTVYWKMNDAQNKTVQSGQWPVQQIEHGSAIPLGQVKADLSALPAPAAYKLVVGLTDTEFENDWNFWLYPSAIQTDTPEDILITRSFENASKALENGQNVLLMPTTNDLRWDCPPIGREPIFWNRLMGPKWERFLGLVCDPSHPALSEFATNDYYDWQWQDVFRPYCRAVNISGLPHDLKPIVRMIDDWNRNYPLAAVFECRVDSGRLLLCAADLESDLANRPAATQLRKSLLDYMASEAFRPAVTISNEQLMNLYFDNQLMKKLGASVSAAADSGSNSAAYAIDGNPNTCWTTAQRTGAKPHPHDLTIRFPAPVEMAGLVFLNRQDHREHEGDIRDYQVEISPDGNQWSLLTQGQLESTFDPQTVEFGKTISTSYLRIRALSGFGNDRSASLAEIGILYAGPPVSDTPEQSNAYQKTASTTEEMYETADPLQYSTNPSAVYLAEVTADSESATDPAEYALDGNPQTFWHTQWREKAPAHPHWLMIELKESMTISGIRYLPRQDRANGRIKDYRIEISNDGKAWQTAEAGTLSNTNEEQTIVLKTPVQAQYLKLVAVSECLGQPFASVAEWVLLTDTNKTQSGKIAPKPLYRDPIYDGAADPVLCWNRQEKKWFMFYTNRRANAPNLKGVSWVHGTPIGIAESSDNGATWTYRQDANIGYSKGEDTCWAPEVIEHDGTYHMYLTYVPGIFNDWSHPRNIIHLTSKNLLDWDYQSTLKLACDKVIDACVMQLPDGTWRMWYNNERDGKSIYYADSPDLYTWQDKGKAVASRGEGPKVFRWKDSLWMIIDSWDGLGVYRSADGLNWTRQLDNLLREPGTGKDDQVKGGHPDIVVSGDRAYLFYFTHPGRKGPDAGKDMTEQRRSSIQVVELEYFDGQLTCDRNKPTRIILQPPQNSD